MNGQRCGQCMAPWDDLPFHIKITYQTRAQYERATRSEFMRLDPLRNRYPKGQRKQTGESNR